MHDEEGHSSNVLSENSEEQELTAKGGGGIEVEATLAYEEAMKKAKRVDEDMQTDDDMEFSYQFPVEPNVGTDGEDVSSCKRENATSQSSHTPNGVCAPIASPMDDDVFSYTQESLSSTPSHVAPLTPPVRSQYGHPLPFKSRMKSSYHSISEDNGCQSIIICGCAGSRKHALTDKLIVDSPAVFTKVIQHTTRDPMQHEVEGKDFHFVTKEMGLRMMDEGELVEYIFLKPKEKPNRFNTAKNLLHNEPVDTTSPPRTPTIPSSPMMPGSRRGDGSVLYGTSYHAIHKARTKGPKCIVLAVSVEGGIQLRKKGLAGQYILLTTEGDKDLKSVKQELKPDVIIDTSDDDPYSTLLHKAITFVETAVAHREAVFLTAQAQWDVVPEKVASPTRTRPPLPGGGYTSFITYAQVLQHFQIADMTSELKRIQPEVQYSGLKAVSHKMFGPPKITRRQLKQERDLVFAIAQHKLDYTEPLHSSVLQTIFKRLTGGTESVDCPRFGSHWEVIGFQGSDPATDLRATGFLSLFHLLYLVDVKDHLTLAHKIYQLSKSSRNPFPFCVLCINITRIALASLREGYLTKECRRQGAVISVVSHFFVATLFYYYETFQRKQLSLHELGDFLHHVESYCKKNVRQVMHDVDAALAVLRGGAGPSRQRAMPSRQQEVENEPLQFTNILTVGTNGR